MKMLFLQKFMVHFFTINFELIELIVSQPARILLYPHFQKSDA
jgi:hypothetical protein